MIVNRYGRVAKSYRRRIATAQGLLAWDKGLKRDACPFKVSPFGLGRFWQTGWDYGKWGEGTWPDSLKEDLAGALNYKRRFKGWPEPEVTIT